MNNNTETNQTPLALYKEAYSKANDKGKLFLHVYLRNRLIQKIYYPKSRSNWFYLICDQGGSYFISFENSGGAGSGVYGDIEHFYNNSPHLN